MKTTKIFSLLFVIILITSCKQNDWLDWKTQNELWLEQNAKKAGVEKYVKAAVGDIKDFKTPDERLLVITNPPYGERLLDVREAENLYKIMGERFDKTMGKKYFVISPHDEFEKHFGAIADKRRKLYNGMIKCQLYMYFK
mgnify:CR=1 FL=1